MPSIFIAQVQPSYKIWSVVTSHNINKGDTVIFDIGLSGFGYINPKYLKFTLYIYSLLSGYKLNKDN